MEDKSDCVDSGTGNEIIKQDCTVKHVALGLKHLMQLFLSNFCNKSFLWKAVKNFSFVAGFLSVGIAAGLFVLLATYWAGLAKNYLFGPLANVADLPLFFLMMPKDEGISGAIAQAYSDGLLVIGTGFITAGCIWLLVMAISQLCKLGQQSASQPQSEHA